MVKGLRGGERCSLDPFKLSSQSPRWPGDFWWRFQGPWTGLPPTVGVVGSEDTNIRFVFFMVPGLSFL